MELVEYMHYIWDLCFPISPQGSRLTAFELVHDNIPATLVADSAAAALMKAGQVNAVVVGADRVAANGMHLQTAFNSVDRFIILNIYTKVIEFLYYY